jgi:hypothetical protein
VPLPGEGRPFFGAGETLLPWLENTVGKNGYTYLAHESMVTLFNGSEIWIGGLGYREQTDKILRHEYNTIYFNKISQLSYVAVTTAYSRLAMRVPGASDLAAVYGGYAEKTGLVPLS